MGETLRQNAIREELEKPKYRHSNGFEGLTGDDWVEHHQLDEVGGAIHVLLQNLSAYESVFQDNVLEIKLLEGRRNIRSRQMVLETKARKGMK